MYSATEIARMVLQFAAIKRDLLLIFIDAIYCAGQCVRTRRFPRGALRATLTSERGIAEESTV